MNSENTFFQKIWKFKRVKITIISLISVVVILGLFLGGIKAITPDSIAYPKIDHYHFRFQYVYHEKAEDFSSSQYQTPYEKNQCDGGVSSTPVHFHDGKDQIVHIHWRGITGGELLKLYGLNKVGGLDGYLGVRLDELNKGKIIPVPISSKSLPRPQKDDQIYIYTGDRNSFEKKNTNDFLQKTLEETIGTDSQIRKQFEENEKSKTSFLKFFHPITTLAHNGIDDGDGDPKETRKTEEELKQLNNLIGNLVVFVQSSEPTNDQIKERFNNLTPLSDSTCGG